MEINYLPLIYNYDIKNNFDILNKDSLIEEILQNPKKYEFEVYQIVVSYMNDDFVKTLKAGKNKEKYFIKEKQTNPSKAFKYIIDEESKKDNMESFNKEVDEINKKYNDIDKSFNIILNKYIEKLFDKFGIKDEKEKKKWLKTTTTTKWLRRHEIKIKNNETISFDYRSPLVSIFVLFDKEQEERYIIGIGGGGGSLQREIFSKGSEVAYKLIKNNIKINSYLYLYNEKNNLVLQDHLKNNMYIIDVEVGDNYPDMDKNLKENIRKEFKNIDWKKYLWVDFYKK